MNNPIQIPDAKGELQTIDFLSWTNRDERTAFLAWEKRQPIRVTFDLACPPNGHFASNPVPDREIVEIVPYRLLPPPCRKDEEEAKKINDPLASSEPWERVYGLQACLFLNAKDEKPLRGAWADFERRAGAAYEEQKKAVRKVTLEEYRRERYGAKARRKVKRAEVEHWRKAKLETIEAVFNAPHETCLGCNTAGSLNLTFEMVKDNAEGIRDRYLHERWTAEQGIDLAELARERERFKRFIEGNAVNVLARKMDLTHREKRIEPDLVMHWPDWMCLFASVRYRVRFDDGSFIYLSDFAVSKQLTPAELADVERYGSRAETVQGLCELRVTPDFKTLVDGETPIELNRNPSAMIRAAWAESKKPGAGDPPCVDMEAVCAHLYERHRLTRKGKAKDIFNAQAALRAGRYWGRMFRGTYAQEPKDPRYGKHELRFTVGDARTIPAPP